MKQKKSIFSYFQAVSLMMPFVFAVVSSFLSYREIYTRFDKNVNEIQTTQMAAKKAFLTGEVMRLHRQRRTSRLVLDAAGPRPGRACPRCRG